MASILNHAHITSATTAVDTYITSTKTLYTQLEGIMNSLIGSNFSGDAANGYATFFSTKVKPALEDAGATNSLMISIKNLLTGIQQQMLDTVDPQLGQNNQGAGSAG